MRAIIQRVSHASVTIEANEIAAISAGMLILLGIEETDTSEDADWLATKLSRARIFSDANGLLNCALADIGGDALVVSQFTLFASTKKGNRPSFIRAARPETAIPLYEYFIATLSREIGKTVRTGRFGADMQIDLCNDGPITILYDTKTRE